MPNRDTNSSGESIGSGENESNTPETDRVDATQSAGHSPLAHVGPTLESDPEFNGIGSKGYDTPEAQIAGEAGSAEVDTRNISEDGFDPLTGRRTQAPRTGRPPERLRTHLAGDTSSDPHTDVGPDNAATVQHRGEQQSR